MHRAAPLPRPRSRPRRVPKAGWKRRACGWSLVWTGAAVTLLWGVSGWYDVYRTWNTPGGAWLAGIRFGGIEVNRYGYTLKAGYFVERRPGVFRNGWFRFATETRTASTQRWMYAPLWPVALSCLAGGASLVRWGRHAQLRRRGMCAYCGYDLRGIDAHTPCPECGEGAAEEGGTVPGR